jgi:hypothetical protein
MPDNEELLTEIRENFDVATREWHDIREAGRLDMLMIADGPWPDDERKARADKDNPRPCESFDELGQYLNQTVGDMRQNKRAVKVTPTGNGATDDTAAKRAGMIRQIEYDSNAQTAYETGCENMLKRSYGYIKLGSRYVNPAGGFDQELYIGTVPNPDTILLDPYAKEPDWKDMGYAFEFEGFSEKEFLKQWPEAEIRSFDGNAMELAPAWIDSKRIQVASYWRVEKKKRVQLLIGGDEGAQPTEIYLDELPKGSKVRGDQVLIKHAEGHAAFPLQDQRDCYEPSVVQYITNGIEILKKKPQKWIEIPIVPLFGPEEYVDDGGGAKRRLLSMVRKVRGAYMGYCYARTTEIELLGLSPKVPYIGYEGQFNTETPWAKLHKVSVAYAEVKPVTTQTASGPVVLPLPQRQAYEPPIQSFEQAAASFRLAIQSAMGVGGLLNGQRSQNADAKSGKAIEALDRQESQGTFVFISNYERGLQRVGRMLEQGLTWCYDTPREVGSRSPADEYSSIKINQPGAPDAQGKPGPAFHTSEGDHATTISVGPGEQSGRDAVNDFVDGLMQMKGVPPKVIALGVKLKNLGPIGDEIAKAFDPQPDPSDPAQTQQQIAGLTQKLQTTEAFAQKLHEEAERKTAELASQQQIAADKNATSLKETAMQEETKRVLGLATINSQEALAKLEHELGIVHKKVDQAHEINMTAAGQAHEAGESQADRDAAAASQASDQNAEVSAQASDQAHATETQSADQVHQADQAKRAQKAAAIIAAAKPKPKKAA